MSNPIFKHTMATKLAKGVAAFVASPLNRVGSPMPPAAAYSPRTRLIGGRPMPATAVQ